MTGFSTVLFRNMLRLSALCLALAVVAAAAGVTLTVQGDGGWADVGAALMSLAIAALIGGAVAGVVKVAEQARTDQASCDEHRQQTAANWAGTLMDIVGVDHTVETARKLMNAHRTALTYNREHANLIAAQLTLRQAWFDPLVANDQKVDEAGHRIAEYLQQMTSYLATLTDEYEAEYLGVARQQLVDDAWLRATAGHAAKPATQSSETSPRENEDSLLPDAFFSGTTTWQMMKQLPCLSAFLDKATFEHGSFLTSYEAVKPMLEAHADIQTRAEPFKVKPI
jgi:hypothetical protein